MKKFLPLLIGLLLIGILILIFLPKDASSPVQLDIPTWTKQ